MEDYWYGISKTHRDKVKGLAAVYHIAIDEAFENIVRYLEWEMDQGIGIRILTPQCIEAMIDLIARYKGR
jgi:copper homeostasis protein CutC